MAIVSIKNLGVIYGKTFVLQDVSFDIEKGEYLGIIGPNGSGKTTLIKAILGIIPLATGSVKLDISESGKSEKHIGYVPQISSLNRDFPITVREVVLTGTLIPKFTFFHRYSRDNKNMADQQLQRVGICDLGKKQISDLSGGEFQKVLIARALAVNPELLLLDEPTASVDAQSRNQIFDLLGELNKNITIVLVTHDLMAVSSYVKTLACLNKRLVYHGKTALNEDIVSKLYNCPIDLIAHGVPHVVLKEHKKND